MLILNFNQQPYSHFSFFPKLVTLKVVYPPKIYQNIKFYGPTLTGASFTSISKEFERLQYWNDCSYGIKHYGIEATFSGITSILNFIEIYHLFGYKVKLKN
jgi:hypothetical protein